MTTVLDLAASCVIATGTITMVVLAAIGAQTLWERWAQRHDVIWDDDRWVTDRAATVTAIEDARRRRESTS